MTWPAFESSVTNDGGVSHSVVYLDYLHLMCRQALDQHIVSVGSYMEPGGAPGGGFP